jgi:hypothetical protein
MNNEVMDLASIGPGAAGARAQLILAFVLAILLATLGLQFVPLQAHAVRLDFAVPRPGMEALDWAAPSRFPQGAPRTAIDDRAPFLLPLGPGHRVEIEPAGTLLFDGCPVDMLTLRVEVDALNIAEPAGWVDLRPDPEARYEIVDDVLAILARAHVERFRLDTRHFAAAIDTPGRQGMKPPIRKAPAACAALAPPAFTG